MSDEIKSITPLSTQMVLKKLGLYCTHNTANDLYYLIQATYNLLSEIGEEFVAKEYKKRGKNLEETLAKIKKVNERVIKTKSFHDSTNKRFDKNRTVTELEAMHKKNFFKYASKVSLIQKEIYELYVILIRMSSIQRMQIPSENFKMLEHSNFRQAETKPNRLSKTS